MRQIATFLSIFCLALSAFGSQMTGSGTSRICAGGPPNYCTRTDQAMQYITIPTLPAHDPYDQGPPVGLVFVMPDFGARAMRVTDEMSAVGNTQANESYVGFETSSNDGYVGFSAWNPALGVNGGYYFSFGSWESYDYTDIFDPTTMQVTPYISPSRGINGAYFSYSWNDPNVGWVVGSGPSLSAYCFSTASMSDPWCQSSGPDGYKGSNGINPIFDFSASCPNLPPITGTNSAGVINSSRDDTKFAFYYGGVQHDWTQTAYFYDKTTNTCRWLNSVTGQMGGTGMSPTVIPGATIPAPASAPGVTPSTVGGVLSGGTYCVEYTYRSALRTQTGTLSPGETTPSPETCVTMPATSTGSLAITTENIPYPYSLFAATVYNAPGNRNYYIGTGSGTEALQASEIPGTTYTQSAALVSGAATPTTNTAGWNIHYVQLNLTSVPDLGPAVYIQIPAVSDVSPIWFPENGTISFCSTACGGHNANGFQKMLNGPNDYAIQTYIRSYTSINSPTQVTTRPPCNPSIKGCNADSHWAWQDDDPTDTMPVVAGIYNSWSAQGNGTLNESPDPNVNPIFAVNAVYNREAVSIDPVTGVVHRFVHNPTTPACNWTDNSGNQDCFYGEGQEIESQDGKWLLMTSNWDFRLGTYTADACVSTCAWITSKSISSGQVVIDNNGNVETAQNSGTTGSTEPTWPTTDGESVTDGSVTWKMSLGCPAGGKCRTDLFLVKLR